jgi:signal peptidase II
MFRYRDKIDWVGKLGLASILGGALANLIDRAFFGYVADFFEFEFVSFAIFNVADIFITVGAVVFCLWYLIRGGKKDGLREGFIIGKGKKHADTPLDDSVIPGGGTGGSKPEDGSGSDPA